MRVKSFIFSAVFKVVFTVCGIFIVFSSAQTTQNSTTPVPAPEIIEDFANPAMKIFTDKDGLPLNSVMTLERDRKGFLWIGTQDGAAFYNGNKITILDMPDKSVSNYIFDILAASDGSIWFATSSGGVHRYDGGNWTTFNQKNGLISDGTRCLYETFSADGKQIIWVGTRDGLSKLENGIWTNYDDKDGFLPDKRVRSFLETTDKTGAKTFWIGTYGGLVRIKDDKREVFDTKNGLPNNTIFTLYETRNIENESTLWIGTDGGLVKFENETLTTENLPNKPIRSLLETKTANNLKTFWVGTDDSGLYYFENDKWHILTAKNNLPNNLIFSLVETGAADGSVWAATLGGGVARIERSNWMSWTEKNGLSNKTVFAIAEDAQNNFWFGTYGGGVSRFNNGKWDIFNESSAAVKNYVQSLFIDKTEKNVYAGLDRGLSKFENGSWKTVVLDEKWNYGIWDIYETGETLWLATNGGLVKLENDSKTVFNKENGLPDDNIRTVLQTISGNKKTLWVGTYNGGLARFEDEKWTIFNTENGLPNNRVYDIAEIEIRGEKQIWLGTAGGAVYFDAEKMKFNVLNTETSPALPNDIVYQILQDKNERIYLPTNKGVARLTPQESNGFDIYTFTTNDGLPSNETVSGSGLVDSKGNVWIGTVSGVAMLDLSKETTDTEAKPLYLEKVFIGGKARDFPSNTELSYNQNNIAFEYVLMSPFRESATRYRTQLVGLEDEPTEWSNEPRKEYTFLPDGDFVFKVWGKDANGNISEPVEIPFKIYPAWWRTWWAFAFYILLTALIVALVAYIIYRNRLKRIIEIERVRTRIATDLHDDIGASLSQISILSEILANKQNGNVEDRKSLNTIAETSREMTSSMSDVVWSINPNRDRLRDLIQRMRRFANDVLSAKDVDFVFLTPDVKDDEKLDINVRQQIYLVFKEAINNAVKHSECTEVEAFLKKIDGKYVLSICDNGKGFEQDELSEGNGLINMRSRAESIGGTLEFTSEKCKGTKVVLTIPQKACSDLRL